MVIPRIFQKYNLVFLEDTSFQLKSSIPLVQRLVSTMLCMEQYPYILEIPHHIAFFMEIICSASAILQKFPADSMKVIIS